MISYPIYPVTLSVAQDILETNSISRRLRISFTRHTEKKNFVR